MVQTNKRYGRLTVISTGKAISIKSKDKYSRTWCYCLCDCGNYVSVRENALKRKNTLSCGCLHKEAFQNRITKHGEIQNGTETKTYRTWKSIKSRCYNPKHPNYKYYGEKGIKVCDRWINNFSLFKSDMGDPPSRQHSIDRIDSNGDYSPDNCRWATPTQQRLNNSRVHLITYKGKTQSLTEWAKELGIKRSTLNARINTSKWSVEKAFNYR